MDMSECVHVHLYVSVRELPYVHVSVRVWVLVI